MQDVGFKMSCGTLEKGQKVADPQKSLDFGRINIKNSIYQDGGLFNNSLLNQINLALISKSKLRLIYFLFIQQLMLVRLNGINLLVSRKLNSKKDLYAISMIGVCETRLVFLTLVVRYTHHIIDKRLLLPFSHWMVMERKLLT